MKIIAKTLLFTSLLLGVSLVSAQKFEWVKTYGGNNYTWSKFVGVNAAGNLYISGTYRDTVDFDPGTGVNNVAGGGIFIQKLDADGNFIWVKTFNANIEATVIDASGNIYTTGSFQGTTDFDPGPGTYSLTSAGNHDAYVQKLDSNGNFIWAKSFSGTGFAFGRSLAVDAAQNVYTVGEFLDTVDFDPGAGTSKLVSAGGGSRNIFIQKMDINGNFIWAKDFGKTSVVSAELLSHSITIDPSGSIYTTGRFQETVDFDPGPGIYNVTSTGARDVFIHKMDANGNFLWTKTFGGIYHDEGLAIVSDGIGYIYTAGTFQLTVDFDPGPSVFNLISGGSALRSNAFVQKLDTNGNFIWAKSFSGTQDISPSSIFIGPLGDIYTAGVYNNDVDFDPGTGTYILKGATTLAQWSFVQKMDTSGNFISAKSFEGGTSFNRIHSMAIDTLGNVYTTGHFRHAVDFDPGPGTATDSAGIDWVFVHKMSQSTIGLKELSNGVKVMAHPNPSDGTVNILFEQTVNDVQLILSDIQGRIISTQVFKALTNTTIELPEANGLYLLTIQTQNSKSTIKLVNE